MAFEQKDNSGAVFVNDRKDQDTHPDRTGSAKIGGVDFWVNGWLRKTADGKPYLSLHLNRSRTSQPRPTSRARMISGMKFHFEAWPNDRRDFLL